MGRWKRVERNKDKARETGITETECRGERVQRYKDKAKEMGISET